MNTFEFQFRWGGKRSAFGIDVNAPTIDEAVTKANRFFNSDATVSPVNHPDAERVWINVTTPITPRNIASIYGPLGKPECRDYTVAQWRRAYQVQCSICHELCLGESAHLHQGKWICQERCWDDRLKASE
jgi:formylmethanofuran dehydrogenase subunit E